jgi:hypothetical protein
MDSDGFCIAGAVQASPRVSSTPLSSAPQINVQVEASAAPQTKLKVEFRDKLLRIDAENATLRDTLKAVSARTGAEMQFPTGELQERVFVHLGPASPRDVVSQLLNGVPFNYVILSSTSEPAGITRLILSRTNVARESAVPETPAMAATDLNPSQVYGATFGVDPDAPANEPLAGQVPAAGASPAAGWAHPDGPKLSGEYLDQMQKSQIQQEQQQFAQQLQQQRQQQQQEQPSPNPPPQ